MKTLSNPHTCAEAGAYFMDGALSVIRSAKGVHFDELGGWCGFVTELTFYADYADRLAYVAYDVLDDYPGVWGYSVATPFGRWFARHYVETGSTPTQDECRAWLLSTTEKFFLAGDQPLPRLTDALSKEEFV